MSIYKEIESNKYKSVLLMAVFVLVITALGWVFGELTGSSGFGVGVAFIFAVFSAFFSYYYSDKIVLAISKAREIDITTHKELYNIVHNLCIATGLPQPRVYTIDDTAPNAFATGRDPQHAVICVTTGLLTKLNKRELEGVVAHEMAHIKNFDIRFMTLVVVMVGTVSLLSDWILRYLFWGGARRQRDDNRSGSGQMQLILLIAGIVLAILTPIIAIMIQMAISRKREFLADATAALMTRYPEGLASALEKISGDREPLEAANKATAHMYIVNPLKEHKSSLNKLFQTHPPTQERIQKLRSM